MSLNEIFAEDAEILNLQAEDAAEEDAAVEEGAGEEGEVEAEEMAEMDEGHSDGDMSPMGILDHVRELQDLVYYSPMKANLWYLAITIFFVQFSLLTVTRYRTGANVYDAGMLGDNSTNYLKMSDQLRLYGMLGIFGVAMVTQLLATFGIATGLNLMVWTYLVLGLGTLVGLTVVVLRTLGYNAAWSKYDDTASSTLVQMSSGVTI